MIFSATFEEGSRDWDSRWRERTRSLLTLSILSRQFYACAIPFHYRDIRIIPTTPASRLSSLTTIINTSIANPRTSDRLSSGYGGYTRTIVLCVDKYVCTLSADIQYLLDKMTGLHTLAIYSTDQIRRRMPVHPLGSVVFQGVNPSLILDPGTLRVLLPFQRLHVYLGYCFHSPISQVIHVP
jgi:hypothetical protein